MLKIYEVIYKIVIISPINYINGKYLNLIQRTLNDMRYRKNIVYEQFRITNELCDKCILENTIKKYYNV